ncbi:MAG TPA: mechanosensitive ion channel family protein [Desulfuromonadales bacterium]|nr:mechanosensitive ion channel family protein [Desulfuromonadales bacterium]
MLLFRLRQTTLYPERRLSEVGLRPVVWQAGLVFLILCILFAASAAAPSKVPAAETTVPAGEEAAGPVPEQVQVQPRASDAAIAERLSRIMNSTGWFTELDIQVREGIVFLEGRAGRPGFREWAAELARNTGDVVAVVNRIQVPERSPWELSPALEEIQRLWKRTVQQLPRLVLGLLVLILSVLAAKLLAAMTRQALASRFKPMLCDVAARMVGIPVFLVGIYLVLQVAGLSGLAATVLGGTGLAGLVAGIAFRDILENYLASILISLRNPFKIDDLVEIAGHTGIVQKVTTRGTVLMNLDGNHVQIPNATVYKNIIRNYTANPNRRDSFGVGIGFENEAATAQDLALQVIAGHPAVLDDPEPLVLVEQLGAATVNLQIYFWYDGTVYNGLKVKSSLIRLVKRTFEEHDISMPDEAREVIFPDGVPVRMLETAGTGEELKPEVKTTRHVPIEPDRVKVSGEGDFASEEQQLKKQARSARIPEEGADLLEENGSGR